MMAEDSGSKKEKKEKKDKSDKKEKKEKKDKEVRRYLDLVPFNPIFN